MFLAIITLVMLPIYIGWFFLFAWPFLLSLACMCVAIHDSYQARVLRLLYLQTQRKLLLLQLPVVVPKLLVTAEVL